MNINSIKKQLMAKLKDKEYRDLFVAEQIFSRLPLKIRALRERREMTQKKLGEKACVKQTWVSKLEDPNYGRLTISTLLKVASAFDVALVVDFVPFSELLKRTLGLSPESLEVPSFEKDQFEEKAATSQTARVAFDTNGILHAGGAPDLEAVTITTGAGGAAATLINDAAVLGKGTSGVVFVFPGGPHSGRGQRYSLEEVFRETRGTQEESGRQLRVSAKTEESQASAQHREVTGPQIAIQ